jgi:filamentous hemagglutinin
MVGMPRGNNPTTTTFGYSQNDATIYAGHDLVIAAGQVDNTFANLLAGHDIVVGGVGTTAGSTTPASSLNNTSGNIVAGNNITLNISGAITNKLPPPVPVHQNYGSKEQYTGCMTAGGYKESYCEAYVDQQSGTSSVISAGNNLKINAGSLTNIGSLISAGSSATINVAGPVINEAQTLNAYWHSHWVQETGDFSPDKRHDIWACGSTAECIALYGAAYTHVGGSIDPPQPVGNIAATIQAPNLTITSGGEIQNVGNVLGTSVALTGQRLINGITTANTYTPRVNAPSQVISLSPATLPGLNISLPRAVGTGAVPTAVAGQASFVDSSLGSTSQMTYSPQVLLSNLPANLQPSSTLFYYNPQEEDLLLQQAALQQTGKATFVDGLSYDSQNNLSVTEQEKGYLYGNALDYAKANNVQLGQALTQAQVTALDRPMLWYVEQTVPDPSCSAVGKDQCPTITALMPQVYLPSTTTALSAGGNIIGQDVTLDFKGGGQGSVLNTGNVSASGTLTVDTPTLTNEANQVDVGHLWSKVKGGYLDTTGTEVQPGGFMSAANMDLNVQTLSQIGGALQRLNADGTVDQAGTQQLLAALSQKLGANFTQQALTDQLHSNFVAEGGFGVGQLASMVLAVAMSMMGMPILGAMLASAMNQLVSGQGLDIGKVLEAGAVAYVTAGLTQGMDSALNAPQLSQIGSDIAKGAADAGEIAKGAAEVVGNAAISASVDTIAYGGSFGRAFENAAISNLAAVGAGAIGGASVDKTSWLAESSPGYVLAHAGLGCAVSAAEGTGCAGGAIGGAASALVTPEVLGAMDPSHAQLTTDQMAVAAGIATLAGGLAAGALGQNAAAGATAAQNEALNNSLAHWAAQKFQELKDGATNAYNKATNAVAGAYNRFSFQLPDSFVAATNAGLDVPAMESAGNLDVLKGIGNVGLNLATLSVPGMPDYTPVFTYSNPVAGAVGEMYGLGGLGELAAGWFARGGAQSNVLSRLTPSEIADGGKIINVNPAELRWTQTSAGGNGRADALRDSMAQNGYSGPPIDVVQTSDGIVTVDHTRAAVALEQGITSIPATVHLPSDPLPADMAGRFGTATTWGDAAAYRAANQRPPLPPTGTTTPPRLPARKVGG